MFRDLLNNPIWPTEPHHQHEPGLLHLYDNFDDIRTDWLALEKGAHVSPFQTLNWCENWWREVGSHTGARLALVTATGPDGKIGLILPLMIRRIGLILVAQSLGDKNAAYLNPVYQSECITELYRTGQFSFARELKLLLPTIDTFVLDAQVLGFNREPGFGREFTKSLTGNTVSFVTLHDDWPGFDRGKRSAKTRSKERNRENRLKKLGNFEFVVAGSLKQRVEMFDALAKQKSAWFKAHCIEDIFGCQYNLAFLRCLATQQRNETDQWTLLSGFKLNGEWISLNLGVVHRNHYAGLILSTLAGDAKRFSPGHLLITKTMQFCSENGIEIFNFGAGDNHIKSKWTDDSRQLTLATMPATLKGHLYEMLLHKSNQVKSGVKSNPFLWRRFKHLRLLSAK